jgi:hypothetical protein
MKQLNKISTFLKGISALVILSLMEYPVFAQDSTSTGSSSSTTTTTTTTNEVWYTQPWVWVIGGAVLLLIIVALVRGGGTDRVSTHTTHTKVIKEKE